MLYILDPIYLSVFSLATLSYPLNNFPTQNCLLLPALAFMPSWLAQETLSPWNAFFSLFFLQNNGLFIFSVLQLPFSHTYKFFFTYPKARLVICMPQNIVKASARVITTVSNIMCNFSCFTQQKISILNTELCFINSYLFSFRDRCAKYFLNIKWRCFQIYTEFVRKRKYTMSLLVK